MTELPRIITGEVRECLYLLDVRKSLLVSEKKEIRTQKL